MKKFRVNGVQLSSPIFFPDATRGVIRGVDSEDLKMSDIEGVIVNTYHLMSHPGAGVIKDVGGIKNFMNWKGCVISDSGGFQLLSMIYKDSSFGKVSHEGVIFYRKGNKVLFGPEKCIQTQFAIGSDIMICLDDCPAAGSDNNTNKLSVSRTIDWARRCKNEYLKQLEQRKLSDISRPLLFAVIQGGDDKGERERCAFELRNIGFDGFGFGGWPLDTEGKPNLDILSYTASLMTDNLPKYALGVGSPQSIIDCTLMGYDIFDCVLPTRDARHKRLYVFNKNPADINFTLDKNIIGYIYIVDEKYVRDSRPLSEYCDCYSCKNYSREYISHLFAIGDSLASRLSTIHNLRTYTLLMDLLRKYDR